MEKISIIVPFYNAEKTLESCIIRLLKQTYENIEIVLVNDNSTDECEKIVNHYINNEKISYYKVEEGTSGNSVARNLGIEKAKGDYFIFVDADDFVNENLVEVLSKYIEEGYDLVKYKATIMSKKRKIIKKVSGPIFDKKTGEEAFNELCFKDVLVDSPCLYLFKKELFEKNNLKFERDMYNEDFGLIPQVILAAKKVKSTNIYGYYYIQSSGSIMRDKNKNLKKAYDKLAHYDNMVEKLENMQISEYTKENVKIFYTNSILLTIKDLDKKEQRDYINEIKRRKMKNNIKIRDFKQLIKRIILSININLYLKVR